MQNRLILVRSICRWRQTSCRWSQTIDISYEPNPSDVADYGIIVILVKAVLCGRQDCYSISTTAFVLTTIYSGNFSKRNPTVRLASGLR